MQSSMFNAQVKCMILCSCLYTKRALNLVSFKFIIFVINSLFYQYRSCVASFAIITNHLIIIFSIIIVFHSLLVLFFVVDCVVFLSLFYFSSFLQFYFFQKFILLLIFHAVTFFKPPNCASTLLHTLSKIKLEMKASNVLRTLLQFSIIKCLFD